LCLSGDEAPLSVRIGMHAFGKDPGTQTTEPPGFVVAQLNVVPPLVSGPVFPHVVACPVGQGPVGGAASDV
jgi:hypothetical protein